MVRVTARRREGFTHEVEIEGGHRIVLDEPKEAGGADQGPSPTRTLAAALAGCTAITTEMYAQRKGWELGEFRAELALSFDGDGKPHVRRTLRSDQPLTDGQWARLLEIVANTPVTKAMRDGAVITSERGS